MLVKGSKTLRSRAKGAQAVRDVTVIGTILYANMAAAVRAVTDVATSNPGTIVVGGKEMELRYLGTKAIEAVYKGAVLIWQAVSSCFGAGYWDNEKGWRAADGWR